MSTYNGEKYIQEQLDSLYSQQGVEVSLLVRDDGSNDSTKEILSANAKIHNLNWYQGGHRNVAKSFFELMKNSAETNCEYIAFCDQDDVWDHDKLKIAIEQLKKITGPALYYSGQRLVDENLNFIEDHKLNKDRSLKTRFVLSDFAGCTGVFNKALLNEIVLFEPDYMLMHDTWILRICLALGGKVIVDPEPRIYYRQHSGNALGLGHGLSDSIKQVKRYIYEYQIERVTRELVRGYGNKMISEYRELSEWICKYRTNKSYKRKLLDKTNVDFCKKELNLVYWLKVNMNRL